MRKILNVAEKPSVAKQVSLLLAGNAAIDRLPAPSKYNPVNKFKTVINNEQAMMIFTSVRGHLMELAYPDEYSNWAAVPPGALLKAPVFKRVPKENSDLVQSLHKYAKECDELILWLDCDREGEAIAFEVMQVCLQANPRLHVWRATFSAVTVVDVNRALNSLHPPNKKLADAVDARQELDLRLGVSLTRLMTLRFKRRFNMPANVISYGPCQFPTLGFVVSRYMAIRSFVPENFWHLSLTIKNASDKEIDLAWKRYRVFDRLFAMILYQRCLLDQRGRVIRVEGRPTKRRKPYPMNTITMTKLAATLLQFPAHATMSLAEGLYNRGFLSYPRTETDSFNENIDIRQLIDEQKAGQVWGWYAEQLLRGAYEAPSRGSHDDAAHPPIHPVKLLERDNATSVDEWRLYELIARHFLAVCSKDAKGNETQIEVTVAGEIFTTKGLMITEKNFLTIWEQYEPWHDKTIPDLQIGSLVNVSSLILKSGVTTPPMYLSEVELISLMDKYGVGTDATMHEHIRTIETRQYVQRMRTQGAERFKPTVLGLGLFTGYKKCSKDLTKPELRAETEKAIAAIASGSIGKDQVVREFIEEYLKLYNLVGCNLLSMEDALAAHFPRASANIPFSR